jgi:hypothetical protein
VENECQDIVEGSAPSKTTEETAHRVRAIEVGALTTLGTFSCTGRKKDDGDTSGLTGTLSGTHLG